jgi:predicted AAA+ superfamily ATPase
MKKKFLRLLKLPKERSLFLFGARNTGKSTLVKELYAENSIIIDLLKKATEARFSRNPDELFEIVKGLPKETTHVIIDEVQKNPKLLDVVHGLMGETNKNFIMTGSSARKLKQGGANLLAGRAFVYHMYPLTHIELGDSFDLEQALHWGTLPEIFTMESDELKKEFLFAYAHTYLKEEIWNEHFIRDLDPFRRFLEVVAQCNGKQINFSNIARDVGVTDKTIKSYFAILEDTLIGFFLEPYHDSFRKRLSQQPKFYLFDTGITRALAFLTDVKLAKKTTAYGNAFEHFIILECLRLSSYNRLQYKFSYLRTQDDVEIDLIVERPGKPILCIEIKSTDEIKRENISSFIKITKDIENCEAICICNEEYMKKIEHVLVLPWRIAMQKYFSASHPTGADN